jgi:hypothetical protein
MQRKVALGVAGAVIAIAGAGGVAYATGSNSTPPSAAGGGFVQAAAAPTPAPSSGERQHRDHRGHRRPAGELGGRTLHDQFTVQRQNGTAVVDVQRGQVTKASST